MKDNWDDEVLDFKGAYNSAVNCTALYSPFNVKWGIHPRTIPLEELSRKNPQSKSFLDAIHDTTKFVPERIVEQKTEMAEYATKPRIIHSFNVEDYVWLPTKNLSLDDGRGMRNLNRKFCGHSDLARKSTMLHFDEKCLTQWLRKRNHHSLHCSLLKPFVPEKFNRY